ERIGAWVRVTLVEIDEAEGAGRVLAAGRVDVLERQGRVGPERGVARRLLAAGAVQQRVFVVDGDRRDAAHLRDVPGARGGVSGHAHGRESREDLCEETRRGTSDLDRDRVSLVVLLDELDLPGIRATGARVLGRVLVCKGCGRGPVRQLLGPGE